VEGIQLALNSVQNTALMNILVPQRATKSWSVQWLVGRSRRSRPTECAFWYTVLDKSNVRCLIVQVIWKNHVLRVKTNKTGIIWKSIRRSSSLSAFTRMQHFNNGDYRETCNAY